MKNNQSGAIIVEASLTLTMFICLLASIIALTNLFIVHNRIQYALTQTSNTISHYGYLYTAVGLQSVDQQNNQKIENDTKDLNKTAGSILEFSDSLNDFVQTSGNTVDSIKCQDFSDIQNQIENTINGFDETTGNAKTVISDVKNLVKNPKGLLIAIAQTCVAEAKSAVKSWIAQAISQSLVEEYLPTTSGASADEYLKHMGVVDGSEGLNFSGSTIFDDDDCKIVDLIVQYDVEIHFGFISKKIHLLQRSVAVAWTDGDGKYYPFDYSTDDDSKKEETQTYYIVTRTDGSYVVHSEKCRILKGLDTKKAHGQNVGTVESREFTKEQLNQFINEPNQYRSRCKWCSW